MADPLSIAASVAGLITIGAQLLTIIGSVQAKSSNELKTLSKEVSGVRDTLTQLQNIVQSHGINPSKDEGWLQALDSASCDCGDTFLGLQKILSGLVSTSKYEVVWKKIKWTVKEQEILEARRRLESYKSTLDLLLSIKTSSTTTNIEILLKEVHQKLSLAPQLAPAIRPPTSWRRKLEGFQFGASSTTSTAGEITTPGGIPGDSTGMPPWIVPCEATRGWDEPGVYGIQADEGLHAPDLHSPDLLPICDIVVGHQSIGLLCTFEESYMSSKDKTMKAHIIIKRSTPGDVFFIELVMFVQLVHRIAVPVGDTSLMLLRFMQPDSVARNDTASASPPQEHFNLRLGDLMLNCSGKAGPILVNFSKQSDRDLFLNRLYAIRFMLRHQITLRSGGTMVGPHIFQQRIESLQVGYSDGTEKSFVYPYVFGLECSDGRQPSLAARKGLTSKDTLFTKTFSQLDMEMAGTETVTFSAQNGDIQTIALTCARMNDAFRFFYLLQDWAAEWAVLGSEFFKYTEQGEWPISKIEIQIIGSGQKKQKLEILTLESIKVVLSTDRFWTKIKMEIFTNAVPPSTETTTTNPPPNPEKIGILYIDIRNLNKFMQGNTKEYTRLIGGYQDIRGGGGDDLDVIITTATVFCGAKHALRKMIVGLADGAEEKSWNAKVDFLKG